MTPQEFNSFLKTRRTAKVFTDEKLTAEERQMIIDAANYAPAQNSNRNFIPILVEKQEHKEWLLENIFYMVPKYSPELDRDMPKEYQLGILTAPIVIVYLEATRNLPIVKHKSHLDRDGSFMKEPELGDLFIRNINIGINMSFVAAQAYLMGYDVGFNGCTRGLRNVMDTPELKKELFSIYAEYGVDGFARLYKMAPSYAVCIGKALQLENPDGARVPHRAILGTPYKDGYYTNIKKHMLNELESIRTLNK